MDFTESDEHAMLRAAAGDVAARFGHDWFREQARAGGRADELWQAMAGPGFLSVALPPGVGAGGAGLLVGAPARGVRRWRRRAERARSGERGRSRPGLSAAAPPGVGGHL